MMSTGQLLSDKDDLEYKIIARNKIFRKIFNTIIYAGILVLFGAIPLASVPVLVFAAIFAGISFAAVMLAVTSFVKQDDGFYAIVGRFVLTPMFMFSGTFYPLSVYPESIQVVIQMLPLWHAVELIRGLTLGALSMQMLGHVAYFVVMVALGLTFTTVRLRSLFMK